MAKATKIKRAEKLLGKVPATADGVAGVVSVYATNPVDVGVVLVAEGSYGIQRVTFDADRALAFASLLFTAAIQAKLAKK